jgi:hypothetical protein
MSQGAAPVFDGHTGKNFGQFIFAFFNSIGQNATLPAISSMSALPAITTKYRTLRYAWCRGGSCAGRATARLVSTAM